MYIDVISTSLEAAESRLALSLLIMIWKDTMGCHFYT